MKPRCLRALVALVLAFAPTSGFAQSALSPAEAPSNAAIEQGRVRFARGIELSSEGNFRAALIEFRRGYEIAPHYRILYNIGWCSMQLQDYAAALDAFSRYLHEGGDAIPAARRAEVEGDIRKAQSFVAHIMIRSNVDAADVLVDDIVVGATPLKSPVTVNSGRRKLFVVKAGYPSTARIIDVAGGDNVSVTLELVVPDAIDRRSAPVRSNGETPKPLPHNATPFWISAGATAALGVGTLVTGLLAISARTTFQNDLDTYGISPSTLDSARRKTRALTTVTDVLSAATLLGGGLTVYFALSPNSSPWARNNASSSARRPSLGVQVGAMSAAVVGHF